MRGHADIPGSGPEQVLIVGGGLVGASLAIALDAAGMRATLVEAVAPRMPAQASIYERNLALARATVNALAELGVWQHAQHAAMSISRLHVSRAGEFGAMRVSAEEMGAAALGATLPARELGNALEKRLLECTRLQRLVPARLETLVPGDDGWLATIRDTNGTREIAVRLLVGADGSDSFVRRQVGIDVEEHDYAQSLIVCTIATERDPDGCAYERFSDEGPVALLPLSNRRCGLVLTVHANQADATLALDEKAFGELAQRRFGWKLGRLTRPGKRQAHRIRRVLARSLTAPRAILVGNAAQTIHPIGAQGFNLGLRDALTLAELVAHADDPGSPALLHAYAVRRKQDRDGVLAFSHGLISLACMPQPLLGPLRSLGLIAMDALPPLKHTLARHGMGWRGAPPVATLERAP